MYSHGAMYLLGSVVIRVMIVYSISHCLQKEKGRLKEVCKLVMS